jgi:hypothetical protein
MRTEVSEGAVLIKLDDEVGRGAEVWVTAFSRECGFTGHLTPGETAILPDGNGTAMRMGEVLVWVTPERVVEEFVEAA